MTISGIFKKLFYLKLTMNDGIYLIGGSKGGTGKSTFSIALACFLAVLKEDFNSFNEKTKDLSDEAKFTEALKMHHKYAFLLPEGDRSNFTNISEFFELYNSNKTIVNAVKNDILFVDIDPQGTGSKFFTRRSKSGLPIVQKAQLEGDDIIQQLNGYYEKYKIIIIDCGGFESGELLGSIATCSKFYITLHPSQFDSETLPKLFKNIRNILAAKEEKPKIKLFFNFANFQTDVEEANSSLRGYFKEKKINFVELMDISIKWIKYLKKGNKTGETVFDLVPKTPADKKGLIQMKLLVKDILS
jgi:cellulose biosynthesis protein BcsQ